MRAGLHPEQERRLEALRRHDILDTPREDDFDEIVRVVSAICETPISVINLIDDGRQWFKAEVGLGVRETPLESSICAHAILEEDFLLIKDATVDERLCDNPLVTDAPHLRFYAGALLHTEDGLPLGTVCVLDYKPRDLTDDQKALLRLMARQVMKMLDLRRALKQERSARLQAEELARENAILAREGDHRVMNSLQLVSSVLGLQARGSSDKRAAAELEEARARVSAIANVHRQLHLTGSLEETAVDVFLRGLCASLDEHAPPSIAAVVVEAEPLLLRSDLASSVGLIVAELVANAFKHAAKLDGRLTVSVTMKASGPGGWMLTVCDDGAGLPPDFDVNAGRGVGMRVITTLVRRLEATLEAGSDSGRTCFRIAFDPAAQRRAVA